MNGETLNPRNLKDNVLGITLPLSICILFLISSLINGLTNLYKIGNIFGAEKRRICIHTLANDLNDGKYMEHI